MHPSTLIISPITVHVIAMSLLQKSVLHADNFMAYVYHEIYAYCTLFKIIYIVQVYFTYYYMWLGHSLYQ